jgi:phosphoribosylformylglycinamidine synthase subunit PurSL
VIRDVLGVSAKPIAATDVLCFGPQDMGFENLPEGVLHPRRIRSGVIAGVQDYGNKIGIPTVNGAVLYDPGFTANPLVFCGCLGIAPKGSHPRQPLPGDRIILLGGRTGRDGLRGATFSSMPMDAHTGEVAGASVQIGDPITEKGLIEVIVRARDLGLYHAITDCGAGGLSSAVGEMVSSVGGEVSLDTVRLKYPGLAPWEIWLSEAQERMVLAVAPESLVALQKICDLFEVELTDIGCFAATGRLVVQYRSKVVLDLSQDFLHEGIPQRHLIARLPESAGVENDTSRHTASLMADSDMIHDKERIARILLSLLAHPNIASKDYAVRIYDHEVQGGTIVKPLTGSMNDGPSDACVLKPIGTKGVRALALANGINPEYGKQDAYRMAVSVVDEAVRNAVAVGANPDRIAILDNFCWGDPRKHPETMGSLLEAARGCRDAAIYYQTPFISGKDSLNNEYMGADGQRHAIPPTLLISSMGIVDDLNSSVTMDLKTEGNRVYLVGDWKPVFGGSHYHLVCPADQSEYPETCHHVPEIPEKGVETYRALHQAMIKGFVRACHDLSEGGLLVAAAEMCIGGRLGLDIQLDAGGGNLESSIVRLLFGETNGCLLVEVASSNQEAFCEVFQNLPIREMGVVNSKGQLVVRSKGQELASIPVPKLVTAWQGGN